MIALCCVVLCCLFLLFNFREHFKKPLQKAALHKKLCLLSLAASLMNCANFAHKKCVNSVLLIISLQIGAVKG